jgi:uncharacterized protein YecE (DUF72 family)
MNIYLGTSGFSYKHWQGCFYPLKIPAREWLAYYSTQFNSVELNVTFYRLPQKTVFTRWHAETPEDFRFMLKGSRFITHIKKLASCEQALTELVNRASELKQKLIAILWQLPPSLKADEERLGFFLKLLKKKASRYQHCFEFRNLSWFKPNIYELLKKYKSTLCIADSPSFPGEELLTSRIGYVRFHGGKRLYSSDYSREELWEWAAKLNTWFPALDTLLAFFNNDAEGFAVNNARTLRELLLRT